MSITNQGIEMINYTCYLTEDLLILANLAADATGLPQNGVLREFYVDTYSKLENPKGRHRWRNKDNYTRQDCGSHEIRIVPPAYLKVGPVEALAATVEGGYSTVPQSMVADVLNAFARRCGHYKDISYVLQSKPDVKLRYGSRPELKKPPVEGTEQRRSRLINSKARHIRYALSSARDKTKNLRKLVKDLNKYGKRSIINEEELDRTLKSLENMHNICIDLNNRDGE